MFGDVDGIVEQLVLLAAGVTALGVLWLKVGRRIVSGVRWAIAEWREYVDRQKRIDELIERELNPNAGGSMKDHTTETRETIERLKARLDEVQAVQTTTVLVLDRIVEHRAIDQSAHAELWAALAAAGIDRRKPRTTTTRRRTR